jgi:hypothetical protein
MRLQGLQHGSAAWGLQGAPLTRRASIQKITRPTGVAVRAEGQPLGNAGLFTNSSLLGPSLGPNLGGGPTPTSKLAAVTLDDVPLESGVRIAWQYNKTA